MSEEQRINVCKTGLNQIYTMLRNSPQSYRDYLNLGRSVIAHINSTTFVQQAARTAEQAWMVAGLQRLAALDDGNGATLDITTWCSQQWMLLHQRDPRNVGALRGLGQAWMTRAQPVLSRIHRIDGSSSSSGDSGSRSVRSITSSEDERQNAAATAEAERRSGTQDYVEARGYLQPATEYLERAVAAAIEQETLSGDLLATVGSLEILVIGIVSNVEQQTAEAYMSLGNASSPRVNERFFRRALQLLRAASQIEGYSLSRYLQQYLDDYGRLLD
ncbi:uncharacterized protein LTR77_003987 [Saxophila tyrrhenica]|uniref:Uncharacterized protein n=1 Tax=Saxophila tyrrhenica TaxID=1690608 RepID=A0AAV9PHV2_9PEZI|nr:hypothetical protein LTR77_003987 [Saxophila tyrrhenica]